MDDPLDARVRLDRVPDRGEILVRRPLADEQASHLEAEHGRDDDEQHADRERADAVPDAVAGERGETDAEEREEESDERGDVLEQDDRSSGAFARRTNATQDRPALCGLDSRTAVRSE